MSKTIKLFLLAVMTVFAMVATVSAQTAVPRLWPEGRQLTITQARVALLEITNNGQQFSPVFYLGPAQWEWRSGDGKTVETWKATDWLDSHDPLVGHRGDPQSTLVHYNTAAVGGLFNSERFTALPTGGGNRRNYVVVSGGVYGSLLFPYGAGAPDCEDDEYCYATQEGGLRSVPIQWTATVTVNE